MFAVTLNENGAAVLIGVAADVNKVEELIAHREIKQWTDELHAAGTRPEDKPREAWMVQLHERLSRRRALYTVERIG